MQGAEVPRRCELLRFQCTYSPLNVANAEQALCSQDARANFRMGVWLETGAIWTSIAFSSLATAR